MSVSGELCLRADVRPNTTAFNKLKSELLHRDTRLREAMNVEKSLRLLFDKREEKLTNLRYEASQSLNYESYLEEQLQKKTEDLERLRSQVGQAKRERDELKARADAHTISEKGALAKASALEVQLRLARENSLVRTDMITNLESELMKIKAEVVDARAEAIMSRTKADKKVAVYLKDATNARVELRGDLDRRSRGQGICLVQNSKEDPRGDPR
ncbi:interactor of constitutive active ROPs 5-like [Nicotiana sylvestris]|uniref:interactor of constitutive active ROPs 5-like n=1 Tax=Nicotiana sylvestris TaxID=4096 RepID=UPI00388C5719